MTTFQFFSHRPPNATVHLLSDPFPVRLNSSATLFERAELLSSQRTFIPSLRGRRVEELKKK
jgi:hypothetical protein